MAFNWYGLLAILAGVLIIIFKKQVSGLLVVKPGITPLLDKEERKKWMDAHEKRKGSFGPIYSVRAEDIFGKTSAEKFALAFGILAILVGIAMQFIVF